jgi:hypothetical protein
MLDPMIVVTGHNACILLRVCLRSVYASQVEFTFAVRAADNVLYDGGAKTVSARLPQAGSVINEVGS